MFDSYDYDREIEDTTSADYGSINTTTIQDIYDAYNDYKKSENWD